MSPTPPSPNLRLDVTPPVISLNTITSWWLTHEYTVSAVASDLGGTGINGSTFQYKLGSGAWTNGNSITVSAEGSTTVSFRVSDMAGNQALTSGTVRNR